MLVETRERIETILGDDDRDRRVIGKFPAQAHHRFAIGVLHGDRSDPKDRVERHDGFNAHRQDDRDAVARTDSRIQESLRKASNAAAKLPIAHAGSAHLDSRA